VTAAEVHRVAQEYLKPQDMIVVAVGDRARIEPELKHLDIGPVETRAVD
jgi:zinc protease